jgi:hypothetical protein
LARGSTCLWRFVFVLSGWPSLIVYSIAFETFGTCAGIPDVGMGRCRWWERPTSGCTAGNGSAALGGGNNHNSSTPIGVDGSRMLDHENENTVTERLRRRACCQKRGRSSDFADGSKAAMTSMTCASFIGAPAISWRIFPRRQIPSLPTA